MASKPSHAKNGIPNGIANHLAATKDGADSFPSRPLTLLEALPFTPFTSVNPLPPGTWNHPANPSPRSCV